LITAWVPNPPVSAEQLGRRVAAVHCTPPPSVRSLSLAQILRDLTWTAPLAALRQRATSLADRLPDEPPVLCHHDLTRPNVRGSVFIDWEYAAIGSPAFDLAAVERWSGDPAAFLDAYAHAGGPGRLTDPSRQAVDLIDLAWHAARGTVPADTLARCLV
jgi:aminoglycoside phosphotransferase (APT) family kinase protein